MYYCAYDYLHIFKNIRKNWIAVANQQLTFEKDRVSYIAAWSDIRALYEEDQKLTIRMTKITHTAVYPRPFQRQSVPPVCQFFNEKAVAALKTLTNKLKINEGTIAFVQMIVNWFKWWMSKLNIPASTWEKSFVPLGPFQAAK